MADRGSAQETRLKGHFLLFLVGQKINTLQITVQRIRLVYSVVYRWIIDTENA